MPKQHIAVYCRVSSNKQSTESQHDDLKRWVTAYAEKSDEVIWYEDTSNEHVRMDREGWNKLEQSMRAGKVAKLVVWKIDRLGRNASRLLELFNQLSKWGVEFHSIREGLSSTSPFFKLVAGILASIAEWENETRSARIKAGVQKSTKKRPSRKGIRTKVTDEMLHSIKSSLSRGVSCRKIAERVGISSSQCSRIAKELREGGMEMPPKRAKSKIKHSKLSSNDIAVFKNMFRESWSVTAMAQELGLSRMHVYRLIKTYFDKDGNERPVKPEDAITETDEVLEEAGNVDFGVDLDDYVVG